MRLFNPFAGFRVTQEWDGEVSHSVSHAIDYRVPYNTAFVSPADGEYRHNGSSDLGGLGGSVLLDDGSEIFFRHLNNHVAADGDTVVGGRTVLAHSGNSGDVRPRPTPLNPTAGAHMHTFGTRPGHAERWNWTLDAGVRLAGIEIDMPLTNDDLIKILQAQFTIYRGTPRERAVTVRDSLEAIFFYGDIFHLRMPGLPARQNARALDHLDGDFLRRLIDANSAAITEMEALDPKAVAAALAPLIAALSDEEVEELSAIVNGESNRRNSPDPAPQFPGLEDTL